MWNSIKERIFPFLITLSALSVSASAAFYSVTGLSMLFAGASFAVIIMAASLEAAKLVIASLLYQYRKTLPKLLKIYLIIATAILILITSAGIYGYLSAAYQKTADQTSIVDSKIASLESKKKLFEETRDNILKEKQILANLQGNLSQASTTQYTDKNGNLVVRSNNAAIRNIESSSKSNEKLSTKIDVINDSIFSLESRMLEIKTTAVGESELGPLKYLSKLTGVTMDRIINWYILVIIFVFDPLAIALVIAANFAFAQITKRKETPLEEKVEDTKEVVEAYDDSKEERDEWEEASLQDLQDLEEEEENISESNNDLKQETKDYKEQVGIPLMVDPQTGKLFYEEPDPEPIDLDLDGDGVIEENEIKEVFEKVDTNDDGIIDENEAKQANMDSETANKLNELNKSIDTLNNYNEKNVYDFNWNDIPIIREEIEKLKKLSLELSSLNNNKKNDDNTITYF